MVDVRNVVAFHTRDSGRVNECQIYYAIISVLNEVDIEFIQHLGPKVRIGLKNDTHKHALCQIGLFMNNRHVQCEEELLDSVAVTIKNIPPHIPNHVIITYLEQYAEVIGFPEHGLVKRRDGSKTSIKTGTRYIKVRNIRTPLPSFPEIANFQGKLFYDGQPCPHCDAISHQGNRCPMRLRPEVQVCFKCGGEGHFARTCNNNDVICFACGQSGHTKANCTVILADEEHDEEIIMRQRQDGHWQGQREKERDEHWQAQYVNERDGYREDQRVNERYGRREAQQPNERNGYREAQLMNEHYGQREPEHANGRDRQREAEHANERDRQREAELANERDRHREAERANKRDRQREAELANERDRQRETERANERDGQREAERANEHDGKREAERANERDGHPVTSTPSRDAQSMNVRNEHNEAQHVNTMTSTPGKEAQYSYANACNRQENQMGSTTDREVNERQNENELTRNEIEERKSGITNLVVGDSLVHQMPSKKGTKTMSKSGMNIEEVLAEVKYQKNPENINAVVIQAGTNNIIYRKEAPSMCVPKYQSLLEGIHTVFPNADVIFSGLPPVNASKEENDAIDTVNYEIQRVCSDHVYAHFLENKRLFMNINGETYTRDFQISDKRGVHMTQRGQQKLVHNIERAIRSVEHDRQITRTEPARQSSKRKERHSTGEPSPSSARPEPKLLRQY